MKLVSIMTEGLQYELNHSIKTPENPQETDRKLVSISSTVHGDILPRTEAR